MRNSKFQIPNSKFQNLRFKFVFVALVLLLFSCSPEDNIGTNSLAANTSQLKKELKLDKFTSKNISENLIVNWETAKEVEKNNFEIIEIELSEKNKHELKSDIFQEKLKYELITIKSDSIIHSYLIEAYSSLKHSLFSNSIQDLKNFTGTLNVFELNGSQINQIVVYNGRAVNPSNNSSLYLLTSAINSFYESKNLNSKIPACNFVIAYHTLMWEDTYRTFTNLNTGVVHYQFLYSTFLGETITYMATPYACDAAGDAHYILERTASYVDKSDPCDKLKIQNSNPDFKAKIVLLKGNTGLLKETGVVQKADGTFLDYVSTSDPNYMVPPPGANFMGGIHVHIDPYPSGKFQPDGSPKMKRPFPMFSPQDIRQFLETLVNTKTNNIPIADIYSTMVSSTGTYTLKFIGNIADVNTNFNWGTELNDKFKLAIKENGKELGFLLFLKDNIGINGITLYKVNDDGTSENKSLDINNILQTNPCQ